MAVTVTKLKTYAIVHFDIHELQLGEPLVISALTSTTICSALPTTIRVDQYAHFSDLQLANECSTPRNKFDVLIGSNFY